MMIPLKVEPSLSPLDQHGRSFLSFHLELPLTADKKLIVHKTLGDELFLVQLGHHGFTLEKELHGASHC